MLIVDFASQEAIDFIFYSLRMVTALFALYLVFRVASDSSKNKDLERSAKVILRYFKSGDRKIALYFTMAFWGACFVLVVVIHTGRLSGWWN